MGWSIGRIVSAVATGGLSEAARAAKGVVSGLSSSAAGDAASASTKTQKQILQEQWDMYKSLYLPTEQAVAKQALAGIPVDYLQNRASQDLSKSFAKQQAIAGREASRYGVSAPTYNDTATKMIKTAAEIGARNQIRSNADSTNLARLNAVMQVGQGIPSQALSGYQAASGAYGTLGAQQTANQNQLVSGLLSGVQSAATGVSGQSASSATPWSAVQSGWSKMFGSQTPSYNWGSSNPFSSPAIR